MSLNLTCCFASNAGGYWHFREDKRPMNKSEDSLGGGGDKRRGKLESQSWE